MLFVNYKINAQKSEVAKVLYDSNRVVEEERFDTKRGTPRIHIADKKNNFIKMKCEMTGRPTKDNGFLEGTYFFGRFSELNGVTSVSGIILTAPIYHFLFLLMFAFFIYQCIAVGGFSAIPIILVIFDAYMFKDEFRKQGIIKRYIFRTMKIVYANSHPIHK